MQLHLQNPINWARFTGLEDNNKVIIIMNTAQKSVTLGLLKLTLNKLIDCHSSIGSPLLRSCSTITAGPPSRAACMAQSTEWWHGHRTAQPREGCPWADIHHSLPGVVRPGQEPAAFYQLSQWDSCTGDTHHSTGKLLISWGSSVFYLLSLNELSL